MILRCGSLGTNLVARHADFCPVFVAKAWVYAKPANARKAAHTKLVRKIRLESIWNTTFWVVPAEIFQERRNI